MKNFLVKGLLFLILFAILSVFIGNLLPRRTYWGNDEYNSKIEVYKQYHRNSLNTVFFGSSRILTGVIPSLFDSVVNNTLQKRAVSFNLASAGTWFSETCFLYDEFLKDPQLYSNVDLVLLEFQNVMSIRWDRISTDKVIYYQNANNLKFIADYITHEDDPIAKKSIKTTHYLGSYGFAYLENLLHVGKSDLLFSSNREKPQIENRGYKKLEFNPNLVSEAEIKSYSENSQKYLGVNSETFNQSFNQRLIKMIHDSKEKGIKLIFILPPVKLTQGMIAVFNSIPEGNKIEVCDSRKYPQLYLKENWSDETHFNYKGARTFTGYVAEKILPLIPPR